VTRSGTVPVNWRTSSFSNGGGQCIEVGELGRATAVRDSKAPEAGHLVLEGRQWASFVEAVKRDRFKS